MIPDLVAAIGINIDPELFEDGFSLTWHGLFTAVGIALGVWLSLRLARRAGLSPDDGMSIALVGVPSGIVGARVLWALEHTDQIDNVGDLLRITDGGISVYGAMIGGVVGGFLYVSLFKRKFPKWVALDVAAPGMILGQTVGRIGDLINGEHFAKATDLPWAFRYTNPDTEAPWASFVDGEPVEPFVRGDTGALFDGGPVPVHPVAGGYEPLLDLMILAGLLLMRRLHVLPGWGFVFYVLSYALVRGLLALLRTDEQILAGGLSVPQFLALLTAAGAGIIAVHLLRRPQTPLPDAPLAGTAPEVAARRRPPSTIGSGRSARRRDVRVRRRGGRSRR